MRHRNRARLDLEALEDRRTPTTLPACFSKTMLTGGINAPTSMAIAPVGRFFVAEQGGTLRVVRGGTLLPTPFLSLTVDSAGERGLLGVEFDPNFVGNRFVYV